MTIQPPLYEAARQALTQKCVEPVKRNKDGLQWIVHRFPIKGGISLRHAMVLDMCQINPLWALATGENHGRFSQERR